VGGESAGMGGEAVGVGGEAVRVGGETARAGARRLSARDAALVAVPAALALGFVFAARATPLFGLGVFVVLWRGIGTRDLALAGGCVLAVAVPVLTVIIRPENRGGYNPEYALERVAVHWVAVVGVTLMILALARELAARSPALTRRRSPAGRGRSPRT
jgi:arabinofuranan 3-O-arabinosyltransferase